MDIPSRKAKVVIVLDGLESRIPEISKVCGHCRHLRESGIGRMCDAFSDGIPMAIWLGENNHQQPYPGDHGIQFKPVDTSYLRQKFPEYFRGKKGEAA